MTTQYCDGGHSCSPPKDCCKQGCCYPHESVVLRPGALSPTNMFTLVVGHWYFWAATTATLLGIFCACSLWRRQNGSSYFCCGSRGSGASRVGDEHVSEPDSNGSYYVPPQYSRCSSFHQAPPPYSEVTSKPDLYPLVISYNGDSVLKTNGTSAGYLMVQYFRNFIVGPVGSLSATSTIDSLSSSFICNATNEANNIIPPPYSCTGSLEEISPVVTACNKPHSQVQSQQEALHSSQTNANQSCILYNSSEVQAPKSAHLPLAIEPGPTSILLGDSPTHTSEQQGLAQEFLSLPENSSNISEVVASISKSSVQPPPPPLALGCDKDESKQHIKDLCISADVPSKVLAAKKDLRDFRLREKFRPKHQRSLESESDQEQNFSDLLNLSVCAPSSLVASSIINTQSNPQMDMIYNSVTNSMTSSDISSLANLGTPDSPPRATSPTLEMRQLLDKIQQLPIHHKSSTNNEPPKQPKHYFNRSKAKTLYMPLNSSLGSKEDKRSRSWFPRSAPTTPCGYFAPNFPSTYYEINTSKRTGSQRSSKSKLLDGSHLLREYNESDEEIEHS